MEKIENKNAIDTKVFSPPERRDRGTNLLLPISTSNPPPEDHFDIPTVVTNSTTEIAQTNVTLNGYLLDDAGGSCTVWFEWGKVGTYGNRTENQTTTEGSFHDTVGQKNMGVTEQLPGYPDGWPGGFDREIIGNWFACTKNGTVDYIKASLETVEFGDDPNPVVNVTCAIYNKSDNELVGTTEEKIIEYPQLFQGEWFQFNFSAPKPNPLR